jgi:hypothetical protein
MQGIERILALKSAWPKPTVFGHTVLSNFFENFPIYIEKYF